MADVQSSAAAAAPPTESALTISSVSTTAIAPTSTPARSRHNHQSQRPQRPQGSRRRNGPWIPTIGSHVYWRTRSTTPDEARAVLPLPPIRARPRRPHAIHIIAYPAGYVAHDLQVTDRSSSPAVGASSSAGTTAATDTAASAALPKKSRRDRKQLRQIFRSGDGDRSSSSGESRVRVGFGKIFASFHTTSHHATKATPVRAPTTTALPQPQPQQPLSLTAGSSHDSALSDEPMSRPISMVEAMLAAQNPSAYHRSLGRPGSSASSSYKGGVSTFASSSSAAAAAAAAAAKAVATAGDRATHRPVATGSGVTCSIILAEPHVFLSGFDHDGRHRYDTQSGTAMLRGRLQLRVTKSTKIKEIQLKLTGKARTEWPEGIPPLKQQYYEEETLRTQFLTFFSAMNDGQQTEYGNQCSFTLDPPGGGASGGTGGSSLSLIHGRGSLLSLSGGSSPSLMDRNSVLVPATATAPTDLRRLSMLSGIQSRSGFGGFGGGFGAGFGSGGGGGAGGQDDSAVATTSQARMRYRVFGPGTYDYSFELPIDHHQLETARLRYGSVRWDLHATIDRAGAFKPNLHGSREVSMIRVPDQLSLEMVEPISISRRWEDQLHYDIIISGKSFPIGARIPVAFKLTPLAKVQVHRIKVYVSETIEYWTNHRRVTRRDPGRKILLLEKTAGQPLDPAYAATEMRIISGGGEVHQDQPCEAGPAAEGAASGSGAGSPPPAQPVDNLLGDLDLPMSWGPTEIEANVQLPTCEMMAKNKDLRLHPDCSWKNVNVFHWIKIVLRISRADPDDPSGVRRRHYEISIDSPFTVLNCRATQANTSLPRYSDDDTSAGLSPMYDVADAAAATCGCSETAAAAAAAAEAAATAFSSVGEPSLAGSHVEVAAVAGAAHPPPPRPMHLIRAPSYAPPEWNAEDSPPPIEITVASSSGLAPPLPTVMTPPPQYDMVVGTPSIDGLADYFSRLADYDSAIAVPERVREDPEAEAEAEAEAVAASEAPQPHPEVEVEEDSDTAEDEMDTGRPPLVERRSGRVNVVNPRTPGGRGPSRSMEISRPMLELTLPPLRR